MATEDTGQAVEFCWGTLVSRVLHPIQVEIIEALRWIDVPLTAKDLPRVLGRERIGWRMQHHLRRLAQLDAVVLRDGESVHSAGERSYRLINRPRPTPVDSVAGPARDAMWGERAVLEEILEMQPERLTVAEFSLKKATDRENRTEVEGIVRTIHDLRESGLVRYRSGDHTIEPTRAALHVYELFLG